MQYSVYVNRALNGTANGSWTRVGVWRTAKRTVQAVEDCHSKGRAARVDYAYDNGRRVSFIIPLDGSASATVWHPPGEVSLQYSGLGNSLGLYARRV